jgi:hypothetical protein
VARSRGKPCILYLYIYLQHRLSWHRAYIKLSSASQPKLASSNPTSTNSFTQDRLSRFMSDKTRTTVPFQNAENTTDRAIIEAAERRMAKQINAFEEIFEKADRVS